MLFRSYLTGRTSSVNIHGVQSKERLVSYGVPQGSVLGPILFTLYVSALKDLLQKHDVAYHIYADDIQIYVPFKWESEGGHELAHQKLANCIADVKLWMSDNSLVINAAKTEFMYVQTAHQLRTYKKQPLQLRDCVIHPSKTVKDLGILFDETLTLDNNISSVVSRCYYEMRSIGRIRQNITRDACTTAMRSKVLSKLDYCNCVLAGCNQRQLYRLQKVQNQAARIISKTKRIEHISPVLEDLHWLRVDKRISFKVLTLVYKARNDKAPEYINDLIPSYVPTRQLRSSSASMLHIPRMQKQVTRGAFSICAPRLWNSLPPIIKEAESLDIFKKRLKTYLFPSDI